MKLDDLKTSRAEFAGVSFLTVLAWYALPDVVRSRPARTVIKAALLGVTAAGAVMIPQVYPEVRYFKPESSIDMSEPRVAAGILGATVATTAGTIWLEKVIYAAGEQNRAKGARWGHTPMALGLAVATAAAALVDWTKLSSKVTESRLPLPTDSDSGQTKLCQGSRRIPAADVRFDGQFQHGHSGESDVMIFLFGRCATRAEVPLLTHDFLEGLTPVPGPAKDVFLRPLSAWFDEVKPDAAELLRLRENEPDRLLARPCCTPPRAVRRDQSTFDGVRCVL